MPQNVWFAPPHLNKHQQCEIFLFNQYAFPHENKSQVNLALSQEIPRKEIRLGID